jgi:hypothetical protein
MSSPYSAGILSFVSADEGVMFKRKRITLRKRSQHVTLGQKVFRYLSTI